VLAADLGADEVVIYTLDGEAGTLERQGAFLLEPGSGPRHFAFAPNGTYLYVINELSSTLSVFAYDAEKLAFPHIQTVSTLPDFFSGRNDCAHVLVSPDGKFVYGSNRGHDSIAIWSIDASTGEVSMVDVPSTGGNEPRNFAIDPSGRWLLAANQHSDTIVVFQRDRDAGTLTQVGEPVGVPTPVCIVFAGS
jgi:6-phosphogluconolactonase